MDKTADMVEWYQLVRLDWWLVDKTLLTWWSGASLYDWTGGVVDKAMLTWWSGVS